MSQAGLKEKIVSIISEELLQPFGVQMEYSVNDKTRTASLNVYEHKDITDADKKHALHHAVQIHEVMTDMTMNLFNYILTGEEQTERNELLGSLGLQLTSHVDAISKLLTTDNKSRLELVKH